MAVLNRSLGRRRDWPQLESAAIAAINAGSGNDPAQDQVICALPPMAYSFAPGVLNQGGTTAQSSNGILDLPVNHMTVRQADFVSSGSANTVGNATNNADLRLNVYRAGKLQGCIAYYSLSVNTQIGTAITSSNIGTYVTVTPATGSVMAGIVPGMQLGVGSGGTFEVVMVVSTTATTFTAMFTQLHATSAAVTSILVPFQPIVLVPANACSTTSNSLIAAAGSGTIVPASIYGIRVNDWLYVSGGAPLESGLAATTVSGTSLTATFAQPHSGTYNVGYYVATTSATAITHASTTSITVASAANIAAGDTLVLKGTGADSAKTDTLTVQSVSGTTVTFTASTASNDYSATINITNLAYTSATTTTVANQASQIITVASTTNMSVGGLVVLQNLTGNSSTAAFTGTPEVCVIQALVTNTSITVSPTAVHTNAFAAIPLTATTSTTAVTAAGAATVTLASGTNFATGLSNLYVWGGTGGVGEAVQVTAVTATTFTATFVNGHSGAYTIVSGTGPFPTSSGAPFNYTPSNVPFELKGGDVLSFTRLSNNSTGIATPIGLMQVEWVPSGING